MAVRVTLAHGVRGGMERQAEALARRLSDRGHEITVVTTEASDRSDEGSAGRHTMFVPGTSWRRYQKRWWDASYALLRDHHARNPYDVILSHGAGALGYVSAARRALGIPTVVVLHGSAWGELVTAWRGARSPRGFYRLARAAARQPRLLARWRAARFDVDRWVAVARGVASEAEREIGFPTERAVVLPNGVDTELFRPDPPTRRKVREALHLPSGASVLIVATRLEREKGVDVALEAVARLRPFFPSLRMIVAGSGRDEERLRRRCRSLGCDDLVVFSGSVDHERLAAFYAAADVFVMPTRCHEAFPVSIVEALSSGLPVVASAVPGAVSALESTDAGITIGRGDASALADALRSLLEDGRRRRLMSDNARRAAIGRFRIETMVDSVEAVLGSARDRRETPTR